MAEQETMVHGHIVVYDSTEEQGIRYLKFKVTQQEAKVFFDEAYARGHAAFRDHMGYNYNLVHSAGKYQLVKA